MAEFSLRGRRKEAQPDTGSARQHYEAAQAAIAIALPNIPVNREERKRRSIDSCFALQATKGRRSTHDANDSSDSGPHVFKIRSASLTFS